MGCNKTLVNTRYVTVCTYKNLVNNGIQTIHLNFFDAFLNHQVPRSPKESFGATAQWDLLDMCWDPPFPMLQ